MNPIPELSANASPHELRKAMLRMRLEMHRQELRYESLLLMQPIHKARHFTQQLRDELPGNSAPLWITGGALLLATLGLHNSNWRRWIRLALIALPLLKRNRKAAAPPAEPEQ
ncbi:MAG TPA: hypothetical protein VJA19_22165 [Pseudomonas sp.]|nr:hypothetical protein [Pseudomonas sp.]